MFNDSDSKSSDRLRYTTAILLSMGILLVWTFFFQPPPEPVKNTLPSTKEVDEVNKTNESLVLESSTDKTSPIVPSKDTSVPYDKAGDKAENKLAGYLQKTPFKEEVIVLENDSLKIGISTLGGVVTESIIRFRATERSREKISPNLEEITLEGFETGSVFFKRPPSVPLGKIPYRIVSKTSNELVLEGAYQLGDNSLGDNSLGDNSLLVTKSFSLGGYRLKLVLDFTDQINFNYYLINGAGLSRVKDKNSFYNVVNLSYNNKDAVSTPLSPGITGFFTSTPEIEWVSYPFDWVSVDARFYARVLKPLTQVEQGFFMQRSINEQDYHLSGIAANYTGSPQEFEFFYLPKSRNLLDKFYDQEKEYFFNLFHQFGFMRIISSVMYWVIEFINGYVKNYGWSILIMTFFLKLLVFPLQQKSMNSMQRMQELSPKIKAIRENFKKKPQRMNQELMQLYKKEGVNPLGGCLPMLIPLPVFIALYSLFHNMVEIQGSSFLWIEDLSLPDILFSFENQLPLIGNSFHLLPVIVMISSLLQSYFTPQAPSTPENQKQMLMMKYMMPFFFFFISWNMSSALILYWTAQNIFTIGQTFLVKKSKKNK